MSRFDGAGAWWRGRTSRERWMLGGLGIVLAGVFGWYGVIAPLAAAREAARGHRQEAARALADVETARRTLAGRRPTAAAGSLVATVAGSASSAGIALSRRREEADGRLTVWIDSIDSRALMQWILLLRQAHGIGVDALAVSQGEAGLQAEITFAGAGR